MSQQHTPHIRLIPADREGNRAQQIVPLKGSRLFVGRAPENEVVLADPEVSKRHAEFVPTDDGWILRDLGSSNGSYVNDREVTEHLLEQDDLIELGSCWFVYDEMQATESSVTIINEAGPEHTQVLATTQLGEFVPIEELEVDDLENRYERVRAAFDAVQTLVDINDVRVLCARILEVTFELVDASAGAVLLFDERHDLVPWASRDTVDRHNGDIKLSHTLVEQVVAERTAVLATDLLNDERWRSVESVVISGAQSLMCVPLAKGEQIFGILYVTNSDQTNAFEATDLELMTGVATGAGVALSNAFMRLRLAEEARARESLGRFLAPQLVEQVMSQRVEMKRGGEERQVTVLFADIRGFTSLTERSEPADVVKLLNEYFDQMVEVVFRHDGVLDKFIGDALMAVWGTPLQKPEDAQAAIAAACEAQQALQALNEVRITRGEEPILVGVGIATGRCVAGNIGARRRMEYTVIGDAVNLASRLAGTAQADQILCDRETFLCAGRPFFAHALPPIGVKGKSDPVAIYEVMYGDEEVTGVR